MRLVVLSAWFLVAGLAFAQPVPSSRPLYELHESLDGVTFTWQGQTSGPFATLSGSPGFSSDYRSWALAVGREGRSLVVHNGKELPLPDNVRYVGDWYLSSDGATVAARVELAIDGKPNNLLWVNGKSWGPYAWVELRTVEAGGRSGWYAFVEEKAAPQGPGTPPPRSLFMGDRLWGPYTDTRDVGLDPTTGVVVALVGKQGKQFYVTGGKENGPFDRVEVIASDRGQLFRGLSLTKGNSTELLLGTKRFGPYEQVNRVTYSADGASWAAEVSRKGQNFLLRDGKETAVDWVNLYPGKKLMYSAVLNGRAFLFDGERERGPFQNLREGFAPEDGLWAFEVEARKGSLTMPLILTPQGEFPGERLRFDGSTYTWLSEVDGVTQLWTLAAK